jgi:hypothetical protein
MTGKRPGFRLRLAACALIAGLASARGAAAVTLGQVDDFEDGTTQGWIINLLGFGGGTPPANVPDGGPGGAGDSFLLLTSNGTPGPGGRLVAINASQWSGDYLAAGVTGISASVRNLGATDLALRLYFADPTTGSPTNEAISTDAILLPTGGAWTDVVFPILPDDLTALTGSVEAALSGATQLRLLHSALAVFPPNAITAQLGVDAISAIPEPGAGALLGLGLAALAALRRPRP